MDHAPDSDLGQAGHLLKAEALLLILALRKK
jgi:hypothetical protein